MKLQKVIDLYLSNCDHLQSNSHKTYRVYLDRFIKYLPKDIESDKVDWMVLNEAYRKMSNDYAPGTIEQTKVVTKAFLNQMKGHCGLETDGRAVKMKRKKKKQKQFFRVEEFQTMMKRCTNIRDKAIISVLWDTGIRVSELTGLRTEDLIQGGAIIERRKSQATDHIYWSDETEYLVHETIDLHDKKFVFVSQRSQNKLSDRDVQRLVKRLLPEHPKPHPHLFRHSQYPYMAAQKADLNDVRRKLGHSSIKTTIDMYGNGDLRSYKEMLKRFAMPRGDDIVKGNGVSRKNRSELGNVKTLQYGGVVC